MLARCARCQGTFTTDHFGRQTCPHCGAELLLSEPPGGAPPQPQPPAAPEAVPPARPQAPPAGPPPWPSPPAGESEGRAAQPPPPPGQAPPPHWGAGPPPGGWLPPGPPPPPPGGWGRAPPPPGPELPSPFADRARVGWLAGFLETWKLVATQPQAFFSRVRIDQPWTAIAFGIIAATLGNVAASFYAFLSGQQAIVAMQQVIEKLPAEQERLLRIYMQAMSGGSIVAQVVLAPIVTLVLVFLAAGVVHLLLMLFRGAYRGFDATLTAVGYASGLLLLLAVPGCGGVLAFAWGLVSLIVGLGAIQRCGPGKATAAVLAPAALLCVCCCGVAGLTVPALLKGAQEASKQTQHLNL